MNQRPAQDELAYPTEPTATAVKAPAATVTRESRGHIQTPPIPRPSGLRGSRLQTADPARGRRHKTNRPDPAAKHPLRCPRIDQAMQITVTLKPLPTPPKRFSKRAESAQPLAKPHIPSAENAPTIPISPQWVLSPSRCYILCDLQSPARCFHLPHRPLTGCDRSPTPHPRRNPLSWPSSVQTLETS